MYDNLREAYWLLSRRGKFHDTYCAYNALGRLHFMIVLPDADKRLYLPHVSDAVFCTYYLTPAEALELQQAMNRPDGQKVIDLFKMHKKWNLLPDTQLAQKRQRRLFAAQLEVLGYNLDRAARIVDALHGLPPLPVAQWSFQAWHKRLIWPDDTGARWDRWQAAGWLRMVLKSCTDDHLLADDILSELKDKKIDTTPLRSLCETNLRNFLRGALEAVKSPEALREMLIYEQRIARLPKADPVAVGDGV